MGRSCHAFGGARDSINAANPAHDVSAPGRIGRRSTASAASQHSLFNIDGLPEPLPADPELSTPEIHTVDTSLASRGGGNGDDDGGSSRRATRLLQHATTAVGAVIRSNTCPSRYGQPQYPNVSHNQAQNHIQQPRQAGWSCLAAADRVYLHAASTGDARLKNIHDGPSREVPPAPPLPSALCRKHSPHMQERYMQPSSSAFMNVNPCSGAQRQRLQRRQQQQQWQQQPAPSSSTGPSGTGLLGAMHHLLQLPVGADALVNNSRQVSPTSTGVPPLGFAGFAGGAAAVGLSTEPLLAVMPQRNDDTPAAAAAAVAAAAGVHEASGAVPQPGPAALSAVAPAPINNHVDYDDVRNPMSFDYDPYLEPSSHRQHPQPVQQQRSDTAPPFGPQTGFGESQCVSRAAAPRGAAAAASGSSGSRPEAADADGGGGDAEVVTSDGPFIVLEMKGPRGTPSLHAAAAAAFLSGASASQAAPDAAAAAAGMSLTLRGRMVSYFSKWRGVGDTLMPADHPVDIFWSWLGAFLSILVVAVLNQYLTPHVSLPLMVASFGASAVLLFGVPASKLAQPRNFLGGQLISAVVGVLLRLVFMKAPQLVWLLAPLGMSLALAAMQLTRTVHPPGGASALIAASAPYIGSWYGLKFILTIFFGCLAMLAVAMAVNNLSARRRYPTYWWGK